MDNTHCRLVDATHACAKPRTRFCFLDLRRCRANRSQWLALIPEPGKTGKILWEFQEELSLPFRRSRSTAAFGENDLGGV